MRLFQSIFLPILRSYLGPLLFLARHLKVQPSWRFSMTPEDEPYPMGSLELVRMGTQVPTRAARQIDVDCNRRHFTGNLVLHNRARLG